MFDVNVHGVLNGIAEVRPRFVAQGRRACRQRCLHRRAHGEANRGSLLRQQARRLRDHRRPALGA